MTRTHYWAALLAFPLLTTAWIASCSNDDRRFSPAAPTVPEAVDGPRSSAATSSGQAPATTSPDPRSDTETRTVPDVEHQGRSRVAFSAVRQPELPTWQLFDEALEELLDDLPPVIEEAIVSGQSKRIMKASFVPGVMGVVGRLVTLTDDAYASERAAAVSSSTLSVPCNECSDDLTYCLDDALDRFVDCAFSCVRSSCRRRCKETWRAQKQECYDAHRECVKTCTPK